MTRVLRSKNAVVFGGVVCLVAAVLLAQPYDLSVTGISAPGGVAVGVPVTFGVGISASGASGVAVTAIFQPAVIFNVSGSTSGCTVNASGSDPSTTVTCPATGLSTVSINVTPLQAPALTVVAGVIGDQADSNMSNNSSSVAVNVTVGSSGGETTNAGFFWTDFDGDGFADKAIYRPGGNSTWYVKRSGGGADYVTSFGTTGDIPVPGHYTGLVNADYGVFRPSTGYWFVRTVAGVDQPGVQWGASGDIPVPGQYGGNGRTDYAVWRPSDQKWYVKTVEGTQLPPVQWGALGDVPVPADYDGDGITDMAVFRPSNGTWYVLKSGGGTATVAFGASGDIPVPAAFTSPTTARADYGIFRPSSATWYVKSSATLTDQTPVVWGTSGDAPLPAKMKDAGDARADKVVWRPSNGTWYVKTAEGTTLLSVQWGASGDIAMAR